MSDLRTLIERVEGLAGPDKALDEVILKFLGFHSWAGRMSYRQAPMWIDFGSSEITTSLDAAVALCERCLPNAKSIACSAAKFTDGRYQAEYAIAYDGDPACLNDMKVRWGGQATGVDLVSTKARALVLATLRAIEASK